MGSAAVRPGWELFAEDQQPVNQQPVNQQPVNQQPTDQHAADQVTAGYRTRMVVPQAEWAAHDVLVALHGAIKRPGHPSRRAVTQPSDRR